MRIASLKHDLLAWLYEGYIKDPNALYDIQEILNEHGICATTSIMEYGKALKSGGYLKDYCGNMDTFLASISMVGIQYISDDIQKEVYQLLKGIKEDPANYYPVVNHLEYLPKHYQTAVDLCNYMNANGYAQVKVKDDDVFIRITERGINYVADPAYPSDEQTSGMRLIA